MTEHDFSCALCLRCMHCEMPLSEIMKEKPAACVPYPHQTHRHGETSFDIDEWDAPRWPDLRVWLEVA